MATKNDARVAIAKKFGAKQDRLDSWPAYLGNEDGTVTGSRGGYVYVRYPSTNSAAVEVYNGGVPEVAGLRVMVGYRPERPNLIQALGVADVRQETSTTVLYGVLQNHARQHFWTGSDPVYVDFHQITPLAVYASSGLVVSIYAGNIQRGNTLIEVPAQTLDLTSSVPGTVGQGRYTLITIDPAGLIDTTDGATVADYTTLARSNIPATPSGHFRLAAVRLYNGQTSIVDRQTVTDIIDLRWPQQYQSISAVTIQATTYTLTSLDSVVIFTATATANLPAATGSGQTYRIRSRSGTITIDGSGSDTVMGELTQTLYTGEDLIITDTAAGVWE